MKLAIIPFAITSLRIVALPPLLFSFWRGNFVICSLLFVFCVATDLLDGYCARKLGVASKVGAFFDVSVDFVVILGMFLVFTAEGFYPLWILILVVFGFTRFVFSSFWAKKLYDPIGKYYGGVLYVAIAATLGFPTQEILSLVVIGLSGFTITSVSTRVANLVGILYRKQG